MNKHHPYNSIIERKLEQLPSADTDLLWNDMHSILDKKMPQKKERRRFIFWFVSGKAVLLFTIAFLITGSSIFFLSTKQSSTGINKLPGTPESNEFVKDGSTKASQHTKENISPDIKENILATGNPNQKNGNEIPAAFTSSNIADDVINYSLNSPQTIKHSEKYLTEDQSNEIIQTISNTRKNSDIVPLEMNSIHQHLHITTNHNREIDSLIRKAELATNNVKTNTRKNNENGFYAGIMSGVDLSSIRFRSVKTGSTKGIIIGYALNKKWSIESGLLWDTKRVYDNGSSFDPPGSAPSSGITITAVNGKSSLYEWPVNVKYTFLSGKHNLFATTGLSSYLMRSENYDYKYLQNNQPGGHNYLSYKNETKNWLSVANFSIGYTHKLGSAGSIRVEPYLKLPIKNIGIGNMPITSTGLNVGFTKTLK